MANYRTFGRLDDAHVSDGDRGFQRMIGRINPELLEAGNVYYSQNGRMDQDYTWRPRKGMTNFERAIQTESVKTTLPFVLPANLNDSAVTGVYGTGYFVDLSTELEYIIIAVNNRAICRVLDGSTARYNIAYPSGTSITSDVEFTMANDRVILFRNGDTALEFNTDLSANIVITDASRTSNVVTITTAAAHGLTTSDTVGIFNIVNLDDWGDGVYTVASAPTATTFTVASTGANDSAAQNGAIATTNFFNEVANGTYTAISVDTDVDMDVSEGICTVTATGHGRSSGDILQVYASSHNELVPGDRYEIKVVDVDTYTFNANVPDGNNFTVTLGGKQPVSGGFIHMPDPPWGVYHEGRLIVPYRRSKTVGVNIDELVFSDIFDTDTYDPIINSLRFGSGSADEIIGISPLISDRLLVFCRRSVHVVNGISGELEDLTKFEVTREVGCIARKSIVPVGNNVLWLSDQGVYSVSYGAELNLMANSVPLSEPIEPWIRLIAWEYAYKAVGAYHNNRYYLAIPLLKKGETVTDNNAILIYNFLNKGWESLDTLPNGFAVSNMITARFKNKNELFIINQNGGVHRYESNLVGSDQYSLGTSSSLFSTAVDGKLVTRRYTFGINDIKKFAKGTINCEAKDYNFAEESDFEQDSLALNPNGDPISYPLTVKCKFVEPDDVIQLRDNTDYDIDSLEDTQIKSNIGRRGYGMQYIFETSNVKIRSAQVDAFVLGRSTIIRS